MRSGPSVFAAAALLAACGGLPAAPQPASADPMAEVTSLIGDAACRDDADCRTIALPDKACGGPSGWLAWSRRATAPDALEPAMVRARAAAAVALRKPGAPMSTCELVPDPGARCVAGATDAGARRCELRGRGDGPAGVIAPSVR